MASRPLRNGQWGALGGRRHPALTKVLGILCEVGVVKVRRRNDIWKRGRLEGISRAGWGEMLTLPLLVELFLLLVDGRGGRHGGPVNGAGRGVRAKEGVGGVL